MYGERFCTECDEWTEVLSIGAIIYLFIRSLSQASETQRSLGYYYGLLDHTFTVEQPKKTSGNILTLILVLTFLVCPGAAYFQQFYHNRFTLSQFSICIIFCSCVFYQGLIFQ